VGGGNKPPIVHPAVTIGVSTTHATTENTSMPSLRYGGVKLESYEIFLAAVTNFDTYYKWTENDELFHPKASLRGPAEQILWDLGSQVTL